MDYSMLRPQREIKIAERPYALKRSGRRAGKQGEYNGRTRGRRGAGATQEWEEGRWRDAIPVGGAGELGARGVVRGGRSFGSSGRAGAAVGAGAEPGVASLM